MIAKQDSYPEFVANQVLTSEQLNDLREYLDEQDRQSRVCLVGIGKICGLNWTVLGKEPDCHLTVTAGFGVTSDGYLIQLEDDCDFTHFRRYDDPDKDEHHEPVYEWRPGKTQTKEIVELLDKAGAEEALKAAEAPGANSSLKPEPLDTETVSERILVLYLEKERVSLRSCLVTDCNNKGVNVNLNLRALLVHPDDLQEVEPCGPAPTLERVPRLHTVLSLEEVKTASEINAGYEKIVLASEAPQILRERIREAFTKYRHILNLDQSAFEPIAHLPGLFRRDEIDQYRYDALKDFVSAYNEFVTAACSLVRECHSGLHFPRHLMLGGEAESKPKYCNKFIPSPVRNVMHQDLDRVRKLFLRLAAMAASLNFKEAGEVRLTPSHTEVHPLGRRAVPFYYTLDPKSEFPMRQYWQPRLCCTTDPLWSYWLPEAGEGEQARYDLDTDYNQCSFMRIEGHLGMECGDASKAIVKKRSEHNAEFDLLCLSLDRHPGDEALRKDLQEIHFGIGNLLSERRKWIARILERGQITEDDQQRLLKWPHAFNDLGRLFVEKHQAWIRSECEQPLYCTHSHLQADYLTLRSELLCTLNHLRNQVAGSPGPTVPGVCSDDFPDDVTPFNRILYVSERNVDGDHLIVGTIPLENLKRLPLPQSPNQIYCGRVKLAEGVITEAYVPTQEERSGDFSAFARVLIDPSTGQPFPGGIIPANRLGEIHAWRIPRQGFLSLVWGLTIETLRLHVEGLSDYLPKDLCAFDYEFFTEKYRWMIADLISLGLLWIQAGNPAKSPSGSASLPELEWGGVTNACGFMKALNNCIYAGLRTTFFERRYLIDPNHDLRLFWNFAKRFKGLEHLAGVEKGGTFVLVCERDKEQEKDRVVADFSLAGRVNCCCEMKPEEIHLPPVALPDYRVVHLKQADDGLPFQPVQLAVHVLANDYDPNRKRGEEDKLEIALPSADTELGGKVELTDQPGIVRYRHEKPVPGWVDRFSYILKDPKGSSDTGLVLILMTVKKTQEAPGEPSPEKGQIVLLVRADGTIVVTAAVALFDETGVLVAHLEKANVGETFTFTLAPGAYSVKATAGSGAGALVGGGGPIQLEAAQTVNVEIRLQRQRLIAVPDGFVNHVADVLNLPRPQVRERVERIYGDRYTEKIKVLESAGENASVKASAAYQQSTQFLTETIVNPTVSDDDLIAVFRRTSVGLVKAVRQANEENKDTYRALLVNAGAAFMDRLTLSNPKTLSPAAGTAIREMAAALQESGVPAGKLKETWKGNRLDTELKVASASEIEGLLT